VVQSIDHAKEAFRLSRLNFVIHKGDRKAFDSMFVTGMYDSFDCFLMDCSKGQNAPSFGLRLRSSIIRGQSWLMRDFLVQWTLKWYRGAYWLLATGYWLLAECVGTFVN
jgi:hypothetical protein